MAVSKCSKKLKQFAKGKKMLLATSRKRKILNPWTWRMFTFRISLIRDFKSDIRLLVLWDLF